MDLTRNRALLYGGYGEPRDVYELGLLGDVRWDRIATTTPGPYRVEHSSVLDPRGDRMLVLGGTDSTGQAGGVWQLELGGAPVWSELSTPVCAGPGGRAPTSAFSGSAAILDQARDRVVVFGGRNSEGAISDTTWILDLAAGGCWGQWSLPNRPPARHRASLIVDPVGNRAILFGGIGAGGYFNDCWELTLSEGPTHPPPDWSLLQTSGTPPPPRASHVAIYDPIGHRMVIEGGVPGAGNSPYAYALDLTTLAWSVLTIQDRHNFTQVVGAYYPLGDRMLVIGGELSGRGRVEFLNFFRWAVDVPSRSVGTLELSSVSPNPSRGDARLQLSLPAAAEVGFDVFDVRGRRVHAAPARRFTAGSHALRLRVANRPLAVSAGIYFVRVRVDARTFMRRFVVVE